MKNSLRLITGLALLLFCLQGKALGSPTLAAQGVGAESRYAEHSVLQTGSWAKIRIPSSGIYQLTSSLIRSCGFSDPAKVKIYGYGGALQPESLTGDYLIATDDLKEVPTRSEERRVGNEC